MKELDAIRRLGVIGGVGPEATARLYCGVVQGVRSRTNVYPSVIVDSLRFHGDAERDFVAGDASEGEVAQFEGLLSESVARLSAAGADCITIACNTLHAIVDPLVRRADRRFLHPGSTTLDRAEALGYRSAAVLATSSTRRADHYGLLSASRGIDIVYPDDAAQATLAALIKAVLREGASATVVSSTQTIIDNLPPVDCVILGCTDLSVMSERLRSRRPLLDSLSCLVDHCIHYLVNGHAT